MKIREVIGRIVRVKKLHHIDQLEARILSKIFENSRKFLTWGTFSEFNPLSQGGLLANKMHFFVGGQFRIENIAKLFEKILYCKVSFRLTMTDNNFRDAASRMHLVGKVSWKNREVGNFWKIEIGMFEPKLENFYYLILHWKLSNFDRYFST